MLQKPLTAEQQQIISTSENIKINAVAGSGKTTTIIEYAATRPKKSRILYLAFNKSVKQEAKNKFASLGLKNVRVETAHSLAYRHIVHYHGYKVRGGYKTYEIAALLNLQNHGEQHTEYIIASHINKFLSYFLNSDKQKVQELNYLHTVFDKTARIFVRNFYTQIQTGTRKLLAMMQNGEIEITHDFYLKKFQLSNPTLSYDYILFDEGQDASAAMLHVFLRQKSVRIIVGDTHQQIYGWRYAVNSMENTNFPVHHLSTSFRFPQNIADLAMEVLKWKNHLYPTDHVKIIGTNHAAEIKSKAIIARTNLGLLLKAIEATQNKNISKIYFEGNIHSYIYADEGASLYDVLNLFNDNHALIRDPLIKTMTSVDDLEQFIEKTEDVQLSMMLEVVKEYRNEIPGIIRSLKEKHVGDDQKQDAEIIFSTVHRSKGMEYDSVELVNDFITEEKILRLIKEQKEDQELNISKLLEEINLLYVATTRTKHTLIIPETLLPSVYQDGDNIQIIRNKKYINPLLNIFLEEETAFPSPQPVLETINNYKAYSVTEIRKTHQNAYKPWSASDDEELLHLYNSGIKVKDLSTLFQRKAGAIYSRLKKLQAQAIDQKLV